MKRNTRRAVLFACLAAGAGFVQAAPASADRLCATVTVWVSGSPVPVGHCVETPLPTVCDSTDLKVNGTGVGVATCGPV